MASQMHPRRALLDLMIVGAQKAGTTTLLEYLALHSGVERQVTPEMTWFTDPGHEEVELAVLERRYFPQSSTGAVRVGKLAGLMYEAGAVERLKHHVPDVEVVALLRDPVRRAYSAFLHARVRGREPVADFAAALDAGPERFTDEASRRICAYVERGEYVEPIRRLMNTFGRRAHVVFFDDLIQNPFVTAAPLMTALGLGVEGLPDALPIANRARVKRGPMGQVQRNQAGRRVAQLLAPRARERLRGAIRKLSESHADSPLLDPLVEARLRAHFASSNTRLAELLSRPVPPGW